MKIVDVLDIICQQKRGKAEWVERADAGFMGHGRMKLERMSAEAAEHPISPLRTRQARVERSLR